MAALDLMSNTIKVNATIPKDEAPDSLTLERGLELIAARIAKGPAKKRRKAG